MLANCNYAIILGKQMGFSLVGISGVVHHVLIIILSFLMGQNLLQKTKLSKSILDQFYQCLTNRPRHLGGKQDPDAGVDLAVDEGSHLVLAEEGPHHCLRGVPFQMGK